MQSLCMESFTVFFGDELYVQQVLLKDESNLGCDAEVCWRNEDNFFKHCVFSQLVSVLNFGVQFLLLHHIKVHHISYVKIEDPVLWIFNAKSVSDVQLETQVFLNLDQILHRRKWNLKSPPSISEVCFAILFDHFLITINCWLLALVFKFFDDACKFLQQRVRLDNKWLQHLDRLFDVDVFAHYGGLDAILLILESGALDSFPGLDSWAIEEISLLHILLEWCRQTTFFLRFIIVLSRLCQKRTFYFVDFKARQWLMRYAKSAGLRTNFLINTLGLLKLVSRANVRFSGTLAMSCIL